jgi:autotransporter family porin
MRRSWKVLILLIILIGFTSAAGLGAGGQPVFLPLVLTDSTGPAPTPTEPSPSPTEPSPVPGERFSTLPPGSKLPGDAQCAAAVKPRPENKGINEPYNATPGDQSLAADFFTPGSGDERANTEIGARVSGDFTGTTDEILQWAACKWGIDEDLVRAQAAIESWWRQDSKGDWGTDPSRCPPGHDLGVDGRPGQCPESWGLLQTRYPYEQSAWPGIADSSAFNADTAYAIWRACYEGYEWWLNDVERGEQYGPGDTWGCIGRWFSGRWHTQAAEGYIERVKSYLDDRIWETPNFQEP